jgi:hypothetical protein
MSARARVFEHNKPKLKNPQEAHSYDIPIRAIRAENNFIKGAVDL